MSYEFYPCHRSGMSSVGMTKNMGNKGYLFGDEIGGWGHLVRVHGGCSIISDDAFTRTPLIVIEVDPEKELKQGGIAAACFECAKRLLCNGFIRAHKITGKPVPEEGAAIVTDFGVIEDVADFIEADRLLREQPLTQR